MEDWGSGAKGSILFFVVVRNVQVCLYAIATTTSRWGCNQDIIGRRSLNAYMLLIDGIYSTEQTVAKGSLLFSLFLTVYNLRMKSLSFRNVHHR